MRSHFRPNPILGKRSHPAAQIGRLRLVDLSFAKINRIGGVEPRHDNG
jgi:hypothetical protein